jgi:hypothetical protein
MPSLPALVMPLLVVVSISSIALRLLRLDRAIILAMVAAALLVDRVQKAQSHAWL